MAVKKSNGNAHFMSKYCNSDIVDDSKITLAYILNDLINWLLLKVKFKKLQG
jgi:hypothetical protein